MFVDESGHDRMASPYEVLAGLAIQDRVVSGVMRRLHEAEFSRFDRRYNEGVRELKGKALLKRKVFRHRDLDVGVDRADVPALARAALDDGAHADPRMLRALAQAKLDYDCRSICANPTGPGQDGPRPRNRVVRVTPPAPEAE